MYTIPLPRPIIVSFVAIGLLASTQLLPCCPVLAAAQDKNEPQQRKFTLTAALDEAILKSPRAASARARLGIARSQYAQASVLPNPTFLYLQNFKADQVREIGVQIPIEPPWKLAFRLILAKRIVAQTDQEIFLSLWTLRANVRRAYVDLVIAEKLAALQSELSTVLNQLLDVAKNQHELGAVALLDVEKSQLAATQTEIELDRQLQRVLAARQHLNLILGREVEAALDVPIVDSGPDEPEGNHMLPDFNHDVEQLTVLIAQAREERPQLRLLKQQIKANQANLMNTAGNIIPNPVIAFGALTATDIGPSTGVQKGYSVAANMDIPIFNSQQGQLAQFHATDRQLKAELLAQRNIAADEIAAAYRRLVMARRTIRSYRDRLLAKSQKVVQMSKQSYQFGRSDITAALVAAQANIQIQTQYITVLAEYQQAVTDLELAVGRQLQ